MIPEKLKEQFANEINRSLLLTDEDKQYWLQNMDNLPQTLVEYFMKILSDKNQLVDSYINHALQDDPNILPELKEKVRKMKKEILHLEESEENKPEDVEKLLEESLNNL